MLLTKKNLSTQTDTLYITTLLNTKPKCSEIPATNHMCYGKFQCRLLIDIYAVHMMLEDMSEVTSCFYIK
jgi:hypothetical protein